MAAAPSHRHVTLDSDGGVSVRSTKPCTVEFLSHHAAHDDEVAWSAVHILDTFVECMNKSGRVSQRETTDIVECLRNMERRQKLDSAQLASHTVMELAQKIEQTGNTVMAHTTDARDQIIFSVDGAVRASVEKLNVGTIAAMVSGAVREWLLVEVNCLKQGQITAATSQRDLEGRIRDVVTDIVSQPQVVRHEHLISMLTGLPAQVSQMCAKATTDAFVGKENDVRTSLSDKMSDLRFRLDEALAVQSREVRETRSAVCAVTDKVQHDLARLLSEGKEREGELKSVAAAQLGYVPALLKATLNDTFKVLETQSQDVKTLVYSTQQQLMRLERSMTESLGSGKVLQKSTDELSTRVNSLGVTLTISQVKQSTSNHAKGQRGESEMHELLCGRLTARDNYSIETVSGISHACDMNIKRVGFPDVRVEVKAHGEHTGAKVAVKETVRFRSDLLTMNSHGIFVSIYSAISGKGKVDFEVLPNNKIAVFLSSNNHDVDIIFDMVQLIYRVDGIVQASQSAVNSTHFKVTPEDMTRVEMHLRDFAVKVQTTKSHLKEAISILNDLAFDQIGRILSGAPGPIPLSLPANASVPTPAPRPPVYHPPPIRPPEPHNTPAPPAAAPSKASASSKSDGDRAFLLAFQLKHNILPA